MAYNLQALEVAGNEKKRIVVPYRKSETTSTISNKKKALSDAGDFGLAVIELGCLLGTPSQFSLHFSEFGTDKQLSFK